MNLTALKMKTLAPFFILPLAMAISGCAWLPQLPHHSHPQPTAAAPIVTPDFSLSAKVVSVNNVGRFVILGFPGGQMPGNGQTMFLYRDGLKVAEVKITEPHQDNNTAADIVSGEAQVGDTVRDQ